MPIPVITPVIPRSLARVDVYRTIKQWIIELQLAPDEILRDHELAERLGVSRTPVREALRQLEDEGLVVTRFHKWTKVAPSDINEIAQLYPVLAALEATAAELALPHLSRADLAQLNDINTALALAIAQSDIQAATAWDAQFHALIVQKSQNTEIEKILASLLPRVKRIELAHFGNQLVAAHSVTEHEAIIQALQNGDAVAAAQAMKKNWQLDAADLALIKPPL
ncbi:GntR family transcriptional regulator [Undibacterium sp. TJN19]|uniref:GntR family transcriptional regulator n=1 Tax=Undibacterium sp. TJN19 TaxID=3413055 RepID=UPI003BF036CF